MEKTRELLEQFKEFMVREGKSVNTRKSYELNVQGYIIWFTETYGADFQKLYRENVLEYKSYLSNVKRHKEKSLSAKTVNTKLSSLKLFNKFLIEKGIQNDEVVHNSDSIKVQSSYANPTDITKADVENFRQRILESGDRRLYALVTLLAYGGLRISEALDIMLNDLSLESKELVVRSGKGEKQRIVYLNSKVLGALREYIKVRTKPESEYLFTSRESKKVDRTVINRHFKKHSDNITPHQLRHFFCTNALESGFAIHEVAHLAGHSSVQTTLLYTNPNRETMKNKTEML
jgi:integrase/recombinase XerD